MAAVVLVAWLIMKPDFQEHVGEVVAPPTISPTPVAFVSAEGGDPVFVTFSTSTALLNGIGYSNILFNQVEAASGAKYEAPSENLTLWNKGDEVTIQRGRKILFVGINQETYLPSDVATSTLEVATTTESLNLSGTYIWVETVKGAETTVPKQAGTFAVTFSDGTIRGVTDCNDFSGPYTKEANNINIGSLATTKKFCEGSQDIEFTQQFIGSLSVGVSGSTLTLTHSDGTTSRFEAKQ